LQPNPSSIVAKDQPGQISNALLDWYDRHARLLPWRSPPGAPPADPYRVWLSEIMLQQTTVEAVKPYFASFLAQWPDVASLARAQTDDVMKAWAGLGYYSRARNLKKCAETIVADHGGRFPSREAELLALPGIGPYTAAAIAAIAFGEPAAVVDGNVERVTSRLLAIDTPLPTARPLIRDAVAGWLPPERPGDFAQATMDLGATICTPRRPRCLHCPLRSNCLALATDNPERFPIKAPKAQKPQRLGAAFVARRADGAILLRRRPPSGLLGGMSEVPTTDWTARQDGATDAEAAPFAADWRFAGTIDHVFTHFALRLHVHVANTDDQDAGPAEWWSPAGAIDAEALPTVMKKVLARAMGFLDEESMR
jgi:A/G-specific adenine glycosylase